VNSFFLKKKCQEIVKRKIYVMNVWSISMNQILKNGITMKIIWKNVCFYTVSTSWLKHYLWKTCYNKCIGIKPLKILLY